jgi:hypothetical protein
MPDELKPLAHPMGAVSMADVATVLKEGEDGIIGVPILHLKTLSREATTA